MSGCINATLTSEENIQSFSSFPILLLLMFPRLIDFCCFAVEGGSSSRICRNRRESAALTPTQLRSENTKQRNKSLNSNMDVTSLIQFNMVWIPPAYSLEKQTNN